MKKNLAHLFVCLICLTSYGQFSVQYDPSLQDTKNIQYFKPKGNLFVGDCIPFYHNKTYFLYWLLDSAHHAALNGLGGHQWALSTSTDLINWVHHPVVLGIDEEWEKSICTGSVGYANNQFYVFYATRLINEEGKVNEQLSYAVSKDGIHFQKQKPNPFYTYAKGYSKRNFRDPKFVIDPGGKFHLFVSSSSDSSMNRYNGSLVHLESADMKSWLVKAPLIINQNDVPECPDYFNWNNWFYLLYGQGGRTYYLKSRFPYGPWEFPSSQVLNEGWVNVVKTAEFVNGRRIAAGWIPNKKGGLDDDRGVFGGNIVLRELFQEKDGTLSTQFPKETIPYNSNPLPLKIVSDSLTKKNGDAFTIVSPNGLGAFYMDEMPRNCRIICEVEMVGDNIEEYGIYVRGTDKRDMGYKLSLSPNAETAQLYNTLISSVSFLRNKITLDIVMKDDIIDVSIGGKRCIINRLGEKNGKQIWFFGKHGKVRFSNIQILTANNH